MKTKTEKSTKMNHVRNTLFPILSIAALVASGMSGFAHEKGEVVRGPNGGRVLTNVEPHAEFFVTTDRKVQITFVTGDNKVVAPESQVVTVTAGDRSAPTKLTFTKIGDHLISAEVLPPGNDFPTVVQIKANAEAKPIASKFQLNLANCSGCNSPEYACTCAH